jgi:hypothetical protein
MRLSSKIMILLAIAIVIVFLWGYFTNDLPAPLPSFKPRTTTTTPTTTSTTTTSEFQLNKPFTFGSAQYTITKIELATELQSGTATTSTTGSYILVFLTVTNEGIVPLSLNPADFTLLDNKGRTFTLNQEATRIAALSNKKSNILTESLQPGLRQEGIIAFEVPDNTSGFVLRLSNGYVNVNLGQ